MDIKQTYSFSWAVMTEEKKNIILEEGLGI